jgi:pyrroline-5-carboxylate reductase
LKEKKISFIGCGNMGEAILNGLLDMSFLGPDDMGFLEEDASRRDYIKNKYMIKPFTGICSMIKKSKYLIIAVKPQDIARLVKTMSECFRKENNCIISIAAGISTSYYEKNLGEGTSVVRVMPNTPALYKKGMITISRGKYAAQSELDFVRELMGSIGSCIIIDEGLQHISTAINGSGPAYFFLFCQALIEAAVKNGLDPGTARKLAAVTMTGSGEMIERSGIDMEELISKVASPGGTTERALLTFRENGLHKIVEKAVENALKRSRELEREMT